jgi:aspartate/methionine/tyrosine aminotransferase
MTAVPAKPLSQWAAKRVANIATATVWSEFTPLAVKHNAINLGQGFPSFAPEQFITDNAVAALQSPDPLHQQYCRGLGHMELVGGVQKRYSALLGRAVAENEVQVTNGCTQGLNIAVNALVNKGDEVIVMEPFFDVYTNDVWLSDGELKFVQLTPGGTTANEWTLDMAALRAAVTPGKTKVIMLNTPQNIPGKVWSRAELAGVAAVAQEFDLFVIADEVYDRLTFDGCEHTSIASLPGMWERTVTLSSASKTLTATGWKVGWMVAPAEIIAAAAKIQSSATFCVCTPLQLAVGKSLLEAERNGYYERLTASYLGRRELLGNVLTDAGLAPVQPQGSFFIMADISALSPEVYVPASPDAGDEALGLDWHFCRWLTTEVGVNAIPTTAFCQPASRPIYEKYARFAFCKAEDQIVEAGKRLKAIKKLL